jgi:filamentous hemagglutinin family protein
MATLVPKLLLAAPAILSVGLIGGGASYGEVATDGTAGPRVRLGGDFEIGAELGTRAGRNLFHSFERFSLATGERATFSGPSQIRNVISRVTGGARSDIDGTLRSTIPGADLYFLNPAGIAFGPNASLDLQGSFHVSTADELRFADGSKFRATNPVASSFTVAPPEAFGFLGPSSGPILVDQSALEVPAGKSFSIVGGDITIDGGNKDFASSGDQASVRAAGGTVSLVSSSGRDEVAISTADRAGDRGGTIKLTRQAFVDSSGDGGGAIRIRGGRLIAEDESFVFADNTGATDAAAGLDVRAEAVHVVGGSALTADVLGSGAGGGISITAREVTIGPLGFISSRTFSNGDAGSIMVEAGRLLIRQGNISTDTFGAGNAGSITARVHNNLLVLSDSIIRSGTRDEGTGGDIVLMANNIRIEGVELEELFFAAPTISTEAIPDLSDEGRVIHTGDAGSITVQVANELTLRNLGSISSSAGGNANAGTLTVWAAKITLNNFGDISSAARHVQLLDPSGGGQLSEQRFVPAPVIDVIPTGNGGQVNITTDHLTSKHSSIATSTQGTGAAGRLVIVARGSMNLTDDSRLISDSAFLIPDSEGVGGPAGDVSVRVGTLIVDNSAIGTTGATAEGGRIAIEAENLIDLFRADVASDGSLPGEDDSLITLRAPLIAVNASRVTSLTGEGAPRLGSGEARMLGDVTVISADSEVAASSTVEITGQEADVGSQLVTLESVFLDTAPLRERCGARRDIGASSFTGMGRGGLPPSPDGPLASAYVVERAVSEAHTGSGSTERTAAPSNVRLAGVIAPCVPLD